MDGNPPALLIVLPSVRQSGNVALEAPFHCADRAREGEDRATFMEHKGPPESVPCLHCTCFFCDTKYTGVDAPVFGQPDTIWRNRNEFMHGREEVVQFLTRKWQKENGYRLRKELFAYTDNKIAVQVCPFLCYMFFGPANTFYTPSRGLVLV